MIDIKVKRLIDTAQIPSYAHIGDAGLDLHAAHDAVLYSFERKLISCGISLEIPEGYAGLVIPRSGLAVKHGISIVNAPGLIDSGYRGEIKVILINLDANNEFHIKAGDRIAQLMIVAYPTVNLLTSLHLSDTDRGKDGFGSSGTR